MDNGIFIAFPHHDLHHVDFVVEWKDQLARVNVKTLHRRGIRGKGGEFAVSLTKGRSGSRYQPGEVDYFGVVSLEYEHIWMIPYSPHLPQAIRWHSPEKTYRKRANSFNWDPYLINPASKSVFQPELVKLS